MKTKAVRLYGKNDLRLEEFDLPEIKDDEILATVISDSLCMSSYKAQAQGADHKRVPNDIDKKPIIIGHEFCGEILKVGKKWADKFEVGKKYAIQPALNYKGTLDAPGYSFRYIGGDTTHIVIPNEVMEMNCLLDYDGDAYFMASLAEPVSCIIGGFREQFHSSPEVHEHHLGIKEGGNTLILAGAGPMGLSAIDYAIHNEDKKPGLLVVTDIDDARLKRANEVLSVEEAKVNGVELIYVNTAKYDDPDAYLMELTKGHGYDDAFVYAPIAPLVEQADRLLAQGACMNFFAGPTKTEFSSKINFYNVHYNGIRITGTSGGNTADLMEALDLSAKGKINPSIMVTHIGGLDSVVDATINLPHIPGGKKLVYTHIAMPLTAIADFEELGNSSELFAKLSEICKKHKGLWSTEAEKYLLANASKI